ncbi:MULTISPECIES: hypothetical protein [unclassified Bradyrhizobium]
MTIHVNPVSGTEQPCLFETGAYARTSDGTVYIHGCEGGRYQAVRTDRDEEGEHHASELTPWSPLFGEGVVEAGTEGCITGIVVEARDTTSLVKWPGFVRLQTWLNTDLEPAWTS